MDIIEEMFAACSIVESRTFIMQKACISPVGVSWRTQVLRLLSDGSLQFEASTGGAWRSAPRGSLRITFPTGVDSPMQQSLFCLVPGTSHVFAQVLGVENHPFLLIEL